MRSEERCVGACFLLANSQKRKKNALFRARVEREIIFFLNIQEIYEKDKKKKGNKEKENEKGGNATYQHVNPREWA
jgi:hypothetical protein